jgi:APA family basic amino acid/polyamine antiporter
MTVVVIVALIFVDPVKIAKLASGFQLLMFGLLSLAVIVMRESRIDAYDPGFRSPFYPWMHLAGMVGSAGLIYKMGWLPSLCTLGLIVAGTIWYKKYASARVTRYGAIYHVFERLGRRRFSGLDIELRGILKEKGAREGDPFDEVVARAEVLDAAMGVGFEEMTLRAAEHLSQDMPISAEDLAEQFMDGTSLGATPVAGGVALPHVRAPGIDRPRLCIVRSIEGIPVAGLPGNEENASIRVWAVFFLVSPEGDPTQHLRMLAHLAGTVESQDFMGRWLLAHSAQELREILLRDERYLSLLVSPAHRWAGSTLREIELPEGCLIVMIRRGHELVVPGGETLLEAGDRLTIIGDVAGIEALRGQGA